MHLVFMTYGRRDCVETLLREMEAQKHYLTFRKKGEEGKKILTQGSVRQLPFGVIEYIFPREDKDLVLNTLNCELNRYNIPKSIMLILRKIFRCKKIPKYEKGLGYPWIKDHVNFIFIGIREDVDLVEEIEGEFKGWSHEAL